MFALAYDEELANRHGPLVRLAAAIAGGSDDDAAVALRDEVDCSPAPAGSRLVTLRRSRAAGIMRHAEGIELAYAEPAAEASIAALIACVAAPGGPIAADPESLAVLALAQRLAVTDIPVLINGPTGTGKEVLAQFIHRRSARAGKPFIAVNCAAMPEAMLEALLFGHVKGAFTGASAASEGFFRAAHGGTLLLDEIAEMPLSLQAKLLRVLQEGEVVPIGATQAIKVDVRVIACVNRDLPTEVAENRFRADLYYRLNVFPLALRPLRERGDDIAPLAFALAIRHTSPGADNCARVPWFSNAALAMLRIHSWPGNVRELENVVRRALLLAGQAPVVTPEHIVFDQPARLVGGSAAPIASAAPVTDGKLSNIVQLSEARAIMDTLAACNGSRIAAARELGISERTLRYRLASFREAGLSVAGRRQ